MVVLINDGRGRTMAPIIRENSLYKIAPGTSWTQAEANAVGLGGHLATVNSALEDAFIWEQYGTQSASNDGNYWGYWIGLNRPMGSSHLSWENWSWISGEAKTYQNPSFIPGITGEPNGGYSDLYTHVWGSTPQKTRTQPLWNDATNIGKL